MGIGGRGLSATTGKLSTANATSAGPSRSDLNCLSIPYSTTDGLPPQPIITCTATTKASSTAGRTNEAAIEKPTWFFGESTPCSNYMATVSPSTSATFPAPRTPQTAHHEGRSPRILSSCLPSPCLETCISSSAMQTPTQLKSKPWDIVNAQLTMRLSTRTNMMTKSGDSSCCSSTVHGATNVPHFVATTPIAIAETTAHPRPYNISLTPHPSSLRPHCLARDRLRLWQPHITRSRRDHMGSLVSISDGNIDRILTVLSHSHAQSTRETYGSSLLVFHVFCDTRAIPEEQHCPTSSVLILAFIAACSGLYSGKSLENYFYAVRAWHLLHGQPWHADADQCTLAMAGGKRLAPITSKRPKCAPFTIDILVAIHSTLDLSSPLHATVYVCLTTSFYTIARVGEFTVPSLHDFDPQ